MTSEVARHLVSPGRPLTPPPLPSASPSPGTRLPGPPPRRSRDPSAISSAWGSGLGARSPGPAASSSGGDCEPRPSSAPPAHLPGAPRAPAAGWSHRGGEEGFSFSCCSAGDAWRGRPLPPEAGPRADPHSSLRVRCWSGWKFLPCSLVSPEVKSETLIVGPLFL